MNELANRALLLAFSATVVVGCAPEAADDPGMAGAGEAQGTSTGGEAPNASDEPGMPGTEDGAPQVSPQAILPGQCQIQAPNGKYWKATGKPKNPGIRLAKNPRDCEKASARFGWIVETIGNFVRIRSAYHFGHCVAFSDPLSEPIGLKPCALSNSQLLTIAPASGSSDKICSIPGLCITAQGNKLYASTLWAAPEWYLDCC